MGIVANRMYSAKISLYAGNFAIIVNITVHSENSASVFVFKRLRFGFSHFYPCNSF